MESGWDHSLNGHRDIITVSTLILLQLNYYQHGMNCFNSGCPMNSLAFDKISQQVLKEAAIYAHHRVVS